MSTDPKLRRPLTPHGAFGSTRPRPQQDVKSAGKPEDDGAPDADAEATPTPQRARSNGTIVGLGFDFGNERPNAAVGVEGTGTLTPTASSGERDGWAAQGGADATRSEAPTLPPADGLDLSPLREMSAAVTVRPAPVSAWPPTDPPMASQEPDPAAFDLIERTQPSSRLDLEGEMRELMALDDLSGALRIAELILGRQADHLAAKQCAEDCRSRLVRLYASKLGPLEQAAHVALPDSEVRWLGLDHRAGFVLSRVDGMASLEELLDISGMPRLEGLKTLVELLERGAIRLEA